MRKMILALLPVAALALGLEKEAVAQCGCGGSTVTVKAMYNGSPLSGANIVTGYTLFSGTATISAASIGFKLFPLSGSTDPSGNLLVTSQWKCLKSLGGITMTFSSNTPKLISGKMKVLTGSAKIIVVPGRSSTATIYVK